MPWRNQLTSLFRMNFSHARTKPKLRYPLLHLPCLQRDPSTFLSLHPGKIQIQSFRKKTGTKKNVWKQPEDESIRCTQGWIFVIFHHRERCNKMYLVSCGARQKFGTPRTILRILKCFPKFEVQKVHEGCPSSVRFQICQRTLQGGRRSLWVSLYEYFLLQWTSG